MIKLLARSIARPLGSPLFLMIVGWLWRNRVRFTDVLIPGRGSTNASGSRGHRTNPPKVK